MQIFVRSALNQSIFCNVRAIRGVTTTLVITIHFVRNFNNSGKYFSTWEQNKFHKLGKNIANNSFAPY